MALICGVDVSKSTLEARVGVSGRAGSFANDGAGVAALAAFCREHGVTLAVMEATGGHERLAYSLLWADGVPAAVVNPYAVRCYARSMGRPEKTDRLDAGMIAGFAGARGVVAQPPPSAEQNRLRALVKRLRQLVEVQTMQKNQRKLVTEPAVLADFERMLGFLKTSIRDLEKQIAGLLAVDPLWSALNLALREIKGVAGRTVARLMAELPEIGAFSGKTAAKLAGLAPLADDSGRHRGPRHIRGGRSGVREILYFVTLTVRKHNPDFAAFSERLRKAGKPPKVIRVALAHKLLTRLNAKARETRQRLALQAA